MVPGPSSTIRSTRARRMRQAGGLGVRLAAARALVAPLTSRMNHATNTIHVATVQRNSFPGGSMTTTLSPLGPDHPDLGHTSQARRAAPRRHRCAPRSPRIVITTNVLQGATPAMDADPSRDRHTTSPTTARRTSWRPPPSPSAPRSSSCSAPAFYGRLQGDRPVRGSRVGPLRHDRCPAHPPDVRHHHHPTRRAVRRYRRDHRLIRAGDARLAGRDGVVPAEHAPDGRCNPGLRHRRRPLRAPAPADCAASPPIAAAVAVTTAACAVAGLEGSPIGFGGFVPFATWMLLLITAGVRQIRSAA